MDIMETKAVESKGTKIKTSGVIIGGNFFFHCHEAETGTDVYK